MGSLEDMILMFDLISIVTIILFIWNYRFHFRLYKLLAPLLTMISAYIICR